MDGKIDIHIDREREIAAGGAIAASPGQLLFCIYLYRWMVRWIDRCMDGWLDRQTHIAG